ncbi:alkaline phosphatase synthesis sensor protein PhoR [Clostridium saccharobutylicum]|nr:alkaline phosphatase synthesis sensor protein PhoR [Clostridium saccharobutylicum]NSB86933.1 signal transduction histidine kinase [Clostridium saccharobutylicum]NYC30164.1 signal transduction histidine kinase [Clostridium saccharobutylicum]OOM17571.1 alkaline phosphatase synthesis sensor protein PhoR [Clostridium saccharobutylicum]
MSNMNAIDYILISIVIILIILIVSYYKKLSYICGVLDEILAGNLNQRVRFQNNIKQLGRLSVKLNYVIENFQKVNEKSRLNEESRKKMISNISHDLRTPLTSMLGYMELMLDDNTTNDKLFDCNSLNCKQKNEYLEVIYNKGSYLYNLLEEFFEISKLDSNDVKIEIKEVNVSEIIRQNIISFFNEINKLHIEPKINLPEDDVYALGDEKALNRILNNLINNAIKYGVQGTIIGVNLIEDEDKISIEIYDNGGGIPENEIDYVFDRLYTVEKSRKLNTKSSGIGLTIVKKLVNSLNGTISVSSVPFEKTVFKFTLPKAL